MMPHDALLDFWRQPSPTNNDPQGFTIPTERSEALAFHMVSVPKDVRILEIGCNVGRNLAYLHDHGWTNLEGVEINPHAVKLLRDTYSQLANTAVYTGAAEDVLPTLSGPYDLIFTLAVLEHIHPEATIVFDEMARLTNRILALEPAGFNHNSDRQFPHNLRQTFEKRGLWLRSAEPVGHPQGQKALTWDFQDYAAWWFVR